MLFNRIMNSMKHTVLIALGLLCASPARATPLETLLSQTAKEGLPVAPLRNKIKEGRAKRIPEVRIKMVVRQLVTHMRTARTRLQRGKRPVPAQTLVSVAQARLAGISADQLHTLVKPGQGPGAHRRVDSLVDLHTRGYRGKSVVRLVQRVHQHDLPVLGKTTEVVRKKTGLPHAKVVQGLLQALGPGKGGLQRAAQKLPAGQPPPRPGSPPGPHPGGPGGPPGPHPGGPPGPHPGGHPPW